MNAVIKILLAIVSCISLLLVLDVHRRVRSLETHIESIVQKFDETPIESEFGEFSETIELPEGEPTQDLPV